MNPHFSLNVKAWNYFSFDWYVVKYFWKYSIFNYVKTTDHIKTTMSSCQKEKETSKETPQETKNRLKKVNFVIQLLLKINLKLFIYNIEHKSNYIRLLFHFLFWNFQKFRSILFKKLFESFNIWVKYGTNFSCAWILLPSVKNSIYSIADNTTHTSTNNSESETGLSDFSTLQPFDMETRLVIKSIDSTYVNSRTFWANRGLITTTGVNVVGFVSRLKQKKNVCVAATISKFQKKL